MIKQESYFELETVINESHKILSLGYTLVSARKIGSGYYLNFQIDEEILEEEPVVTEELTLVTQELVVTEEVIAPKIEEVVEETLDSSVPQESGEKLEETPKVDETPRTRKSRSKQV